MPSVAYIHWRRVWRHVAIILGCLGIALVTLTLLTESYFIPSPFIDTKFSDGFTIEAWERIEAGMTKDDVYHLLGSPLYGGEGEYTGHFRIRSGENYSGPCDRYSDDTAFSPWWDFAWIAMRVCYDDKGRVLGTAEIIRYD